jgi:hybrid cluster-associated redox disulfide protein
MKGFVVMSMVYFLVGSLLGVLVAMNASPVMTLRFAHAHLNLLGFMAMMIFGVGYFILPRFSGRTLRWPALVPIHFWLSNATLVGLVVFYESSHFGFAAVASLHVVSIALFVVNVGVTLVSAGEQPHGAAQAEFPVISADMKMADLLDRWPSAAKVMIEEGLQALSDPNHLENLKTLGVTVAMAAKRHGLDEGRLLRRIAAQVGARVAEGARAAGPSPGAAIGRESVIGDVLRAHPQTEEVFRRFYGEGCFSCPGQAYETVAQSASMHNVNEEEILKDLNRAVQGERQ